MSHSKMPFEEMLEESLEPQEEFDDWIEHRDGMRDYGYLEGKERDKKKEKRKHPYKRGGKRRCN